MNMLAVHTTFDALMFLKMETARSSDIHKPDQTLQKPLAVMPPPDCQDCELAAV